MPPTEEEARTLLPSRFKEPSWILNSQVITNFCFVISASPDSAVKARPSELGKARPWETSQCPTRLLTQPLIYGASTGARLVLGIQGTNGKSGQLVVGWGRGAYLAPEGETGSRVLTSAEFPLLPKEGKDHIDFNLFSLFSNSNRTPFAKVIFYGTPNI